jgi:aspartate dehydrogenase
MTAIGLIGCGGMAQDVVAALRAADAARGVRIVGALARPGRSEAARAKLYGLEIVEALDELIARKPTVVAEVASQTAVAEHVGTVLRSGIDCLVISVGALADATLFTKLKSAARDGNSRILLPAGAIGGLDAVAAMRLSGLTSVRYLVADPDAGGNIHEIEAEGATGRFAIELQGKPSRTNPKTSALAALSVARALLNEQATIVI